MSDVRTGWKRSRHWSTLASVVGAGSCLALYLGDASWWALGPAIFATLFAINERTLYGNAIEEDDAFERIMSRLTDPEPWDPSGAGEARPPEVVYPASDDVCVTGLIDGYRVDLQSGRRGEGRALIRVHCPAIGDLDRVPWGAGAASSAEATSPSGTSVASGAEARPLGDDVGDGAGGDESRWGEASWDLALDSVAQSLREAFLAGVGCTVDLPRRQLRIEVYEHLWPEEDRLTAGERIPLIELNLDRAIALAKAISACAESSPVEGLVRNYQDASDVAVRQLLLTILLNLSDHRERAVALGFQDPARVLQLMAAQWADPPRIGFLRGTAIDPLQPMTVRLQAFDAWLACAPEDGASVRAALLTLASSSDGDVVAAARERLVAMGGADPGGLAVVATDGAGALSVSDAGEGAVSLVEPEEA